MNTLLKPFYAVVPLSLEELFAEELKKLGIEKFRLEKGGCWFGAEMSQMMQVLSLIHILRQWKPSLSMPTKTRWSLSRSLITTGPRQKKTGLTIS